MRSFKISLLLWMCAGVSYQSVAQQTAPLMTIKDAVEIALKNNYNIKLTKNNSAIAANNVTPGAAGMLPQVNLNASVANSIQNTKQIRTDGSVNQTNGAANGNYGLGIGLNWTVFNGFLMYANYDQLKKLSELSELAQRDTIESTVASVINTYYNLVNQNQLIIAQKGAIDISRTQMRYANDKFDVGRASRLNVLNAQVNLNTDTAILLAGLQQFRSLKIRMNQLLVQPMQTDFSVVDTIIIDDKLVLGDIINQAQSQSPAILISQINRELADISLRQVRAGRYPTVGISTGYNFSYIRTPSNLVTHQQDLNGLNYGLTASFNIFDGFNQSRKEKNARIQIDKSTINLAQTKQNIEAQINNLYVIYLSGLDLVKLNQSNVAVAKRNMDISLEKYKLGSITPLEIREAQKNYLDAQSRYYAAQYQAKTAEITLKEITNNINIQ
jgi:outer membrane protein